MGTAWFWQARVRMIIIVGMEMCIVVECGVGGVTVGGGGGGGGGGKRGKRGDVMRVLRRMKG